MSRNACFTALAVALVGLMVPLRPAGAETLPAIRTIDRVSVASAGKVTIVNFWATWCAPCRAELPILDAFYRRHRAQGLNMIAVSLDSGASDRKLHEVTRAFAFAVARVADTKFPRPDIPRALPETRIYDHSGHLVFSTRGDGRSTIDAATLERVVSPLLAAN